LRIGILQPGDRLPTVKEVVADVAINPNTVLKAYRELESRGLVARSLERWVRSAREQGLDDASIQALLRSAAQQDPERDVA
jgi:GntR family transcriptional regulator